mgnify:FL=1
MTYTLAAVSGKRRLREARGPGMPGPYKAYNTSVKIANKTRRPWGLQPTGGGVLYNPCSL